MLYSFRCNFWCFNRKLIKGVLASKNSPSIKSHICFKNYHLTCIQLSHSDIISPIPLALPPLPALVGWCQLWQIQKQSNPPHVLIAFIQKYGVFKSPNLINLAREHFFGETLYIKKCKMLVISSKTLKYLYRSRQIFLVKTQPMRGLYLERT